MDLNEAGRDESALGIDLLCGLLANPADGGDAALLDPDVGAEPGPTRSVDDSSATDYQIEHVLTPSSSNPF